MVGSPPLSSAGLQAGWLNDFMKSNEGLLINIVLGIVGAAIASAILSFFGIVLGGWIGYLICGFIGACLLIWIVRAVRAAQHEDFDRYNILMQWKAYSRAP